MVKASKGLRCGARRKLKKGLRQKFKPETIIQEFKSGDKVIIAINPSSQKGMPHLRFKGKIGTIKGKRGGAYILSVSIGKKSTEIQANPEHFRKL